jgi:hypothetical protein
VVWTAKENKPEGSVTDSIIFWVLLGIEKGLEVVRIKKSNRQSVTTDLLYDQPSQAMSDEYDFRRKCSLARIIKIITKS